MELHLMPAQHAQTTFLWGFGLGLAASALLFYIWHTESLIQLQQEWLSQQQQQQQQNQRSVKTQLETIDLLMKSYSISDGTEDQDMRAELIRNQHLVLLQQVQQQAGVDISDLLDPARPFNSAQLYAALLRIKQQHEKNSARQQLDQRVLQQNAPTVAAG
jgi:hypothetical protein